MPSATPWPSGTHALPRKPVVLIAESGSGYGGTAKYLAELTSGLDRDRFDVRVVASFEGPFIGRVRAMGLPVDLKPAWRFPKGETPGVAESRPSTGAARLARYARHGLEMIAQLSTSVPEIIGWLRHHRVRLVHLNNEVLSHLPLLLASRLAGCRVICHLHGWRALTITERWAIWLADELVCVTEAGARYHSRQLSGRPVLAIPNGLSVNGQLEHFTQKRDRQRRELGISAEQVMVTIVGRLVPWKGHEVFLRALGRAGERDSRLAGLVVGRDPSGDQALAKRLQRLAREIGLAERVRFVSWQDDVWPVYAASDIVVHASVEPEPFGFVILEAMAAGRPVIATRGGGVEELVVDGITGRVVEPGDVEGLASAIAQLAADRALADRYSRQGERRARSVFPFSRNVEEISHLYDRLLSNGEVRSET